jgi:predicted DNA-binding protein with PD1-like motif
MSAALDLYAKLTETTDEKERARLIASAFDALEARFPQINELATQGHVRETELRLQKEIKEVEARLQKEIREVEARLQERIKGIELQIKQVEVNLHQAMAAQTRWLLGGLAVLGAVFKIADLLIGP